MPEENTIFLDIVTNPLTLCLITAISVIISAIISSRKVSSTKIDEERYRLIYAVLINLFAGVGFRFSTSEEIAEIVNEVKQIAYANRALSGEWLIFYIDCYFDAPDAKAQRKAFDNLMEYSVKEYNNLCKRLNIPKLRYYLRNKRNWFDIYSYKMMFLLMLQSTVKFIVLFVPMWICILFAFVIALNAIS